MKIKKNNILTLDKYIYECLYNNKDGYYMKNNPFGKDGDFITAPNISILFSEMIALWTILFWENLKCPKKFNLIELGAGNGEMILQLLKTFKNFPIFKASCKVNIFEKSNYLKKIQKKKLKNYKVTWLKNLNEITKSPNLFIGNEFFDALPIKQFIKKEDKWYERSVQFLELNKPHFIDILIDIKKVEKKIGFKISHNQEFIEYSPLSHKYLKDISTKINDNTGGLLIIDYGDLNKKMRNTIRSFSKHKIVDLLDDCKKSDITYNINFNLLERILKNLDFKVSGPTSQKKFLVNLGILKRAEIVSKKLPFTKKADIYYRVKKLIDKNSMGEIFKVILATKSNINFNAGFVN